MGWDEVLKFAVGGITIFSTIGGIIFLIIRYSNDKNKEQEEMRFTHAKELEGVKEENIEKIMTRLERDLAELKSALNKVIIENRAFTDRLNDIAQGLSKTTDKMQDFVLATEKRISVMETRLVNIGERLIMVTTKRRDT